MWPPVWRHLENFIGATTVWVLLIIFAATVFRSAFGFGEALVAVPLLAFCLPLRVASPLAVLVSITIALLVVVQDWHKIHLRSALWLAVATVFGIPLGLLLLTSAHQQAVKATLGAVILLFAVYSLVGRTPPHVERDSWLWLALCGFVAGILGGAFGTNGPPLAIYGSMRRWPAQQFRATLQAYFLPASLIGMGGYLLAGLWTRTVTHYYLLSLPVAVPAICLGRAINHRLHGDTFLKYVYLGLAAIGALVLFEAASGRS